MSHNALPDEERTVDATVKTVNYSAPVTQIPQATEGNALPPGTRIAEFEIIKMLGMGGFGIVYLATDISLGRRVALKEYMPEDFAVRTVGVTVAVKSARYAETFEVGLRSFINEAQLLAQFDHPSLVKVHRFWEANGTAYMVMPFYEGKTLKDTLAQMTSAPDEAWLRGVLGHILDALTVMHTAQCFHRDIAPDNILMTKDCPVLLDFGAARRLIEEKNQVVTAIVKRSYAPIEQYGRSQELSQGAWTDLYALGSVMYLAIMGALPPSSMDRVMTDTLESLETAAAAKMPGRYSASFLHAIDRALALKPKDRPQSVAEFRRLLDQTRAAAAPVAPRQDSGTRKLSPVVLAAGGVGLLAVLLAGWLVWGGKARPPQGAGAVVASKAPPPQAKAAMPPKPEIPMVQPKPEFNPARLLADIVTGKNTGHEVSVVVDKGQVIIGKDLLRFKVRSSKPGYLYVLMLGADQSHLSLLFPNANEKNNRIDAGKVMQLPPPGWQFQAQGPAGTDQFVALVSDSPRDFGKTGLNAEGEFSLPAARKLYDAYAGTTPFFTGTAVCAAGVACPDTYGAAAFSIEEVVKK